MTAAFRGFAADNDDRRYDSFIPDKGQHLVARFFRHVEIEYDDIELPLLKNVTFDMVEVVAAANLRDVKVPKVALDADVTDGKLTLQVDKKGMDVKGSIRLGGVPARLAWTENFYSGARFRGRYKVKGVIDDAGRKRLGLSSEPHITGPLAFDMVISRFDENRTGISGTLGLEKAALVFNEIEWTKKPGTGIPPAELDLVVGRRLERAVDVDEVLTHDHLEPAEGTEEGSGE